MSPPACAQSPTGARTGRWCAPLIQYRTPAVGSHVDPPSEGTPPTTIRTPRSGSFEGVRSAEASYVLGPGPWVGMDPRPVRDAPRSGPVM